MDFLLDENVPTDSAEVLRQAGHRVSICPVGLPDDEVIGLAVREASVLITFDSDFGTLIVRGGQVAPRGVLYLRIQPRNSREPGEIVLAVLASHPVEGFLTVISRQGVRQRNI